MPSKDVTDRSRVEDFFYHEAQLLDDCRFNDWLDLLTDDVHYWLGAIEFIQGKDVSHYEPEDGTYALFDDDKESLALRVARLETGLARAESPPSITQHLVTNVQLLSTEGDEITAQSSFLVCQARQFGPPNSFIGHRIDVLRASAGALLLANRKIYLTDVVLPRTLSIFF